MELSMLNGFMTFDTVPATVYLSVYQYVVCNVTRNKY